MENTNQEFTRDEIQTIKKMQNLFKLESEIDFLHHYYFNTKTAKNVCIVPNEEIENYGFGNFITQTFARIVGMIERGELILNENQK